MTQMTQSDLGNTSSKSHKLRGRKWCFTINNYNDEDIDTVTQLVLGGGVKYIYGKEVGESGTPHLQGYLEFKNARSFSSIKKILPKAHLEKAKGSTKQNYDYCSKEGDFVSNIDFETFKDKMIKKCLVEYENIIWKDWQAEILNILKGEPDRRIIHWYWDEEGNKGKSFLCKYIALNYDVIICDGKKDNVFNQVKNMFDEKKQPAIILLDVPRTSLEYINYGVIEQLKNGLIYSGKYEGGICAFPIPHVICFANCSPDLNSMSLDRWNIVNLSP